MQGWCKNRLHCLGVAAVKTVAARRIGSDLMSVVVRALSSSLFTTPASAYDRAETLVWTKLTSLTCFTID